MPPGIETDPRPVVLLDTSTGYRGVLVIEAAEAAAAAALATRVGDVRAGVERDLEGAR
jgi:hypothetical protein